MFQFYAENGFVDLDARIVFGGRMLDPLEFAPRRDFFGQRALIVFVARKGSEVDEVRWPVQFQYANPESERLVRALVKGTRSGVDRRSRALFMPLRWASDWFNVARRYTKIAVHARRI